MSERIQRENQSISKRQLNILCHALGWPKNHRNRFCTGEGTTDFADCEELVSKGLMMRQRRDWVPDFIYTVTEQGRSLLANNAYER